MNLLERFMDFVGQQKLFAPNQRLLLAVSGGVDSLVLTDLCHRAGYRFGMAHAHFGLRGDDSDADEALVLDLARRYGVTCHTRRFSPKPIAEAQGYSLQEAARILRYEWFNELLEPHGPEPYSFVLTAHHADDQIETVMLHFFRGTGIRGLAGLSPQAGGIGGQVVRPLLFARKSELKAYAVANGLVWREDRSNAEGHYRRNVLRNEVLPLLRQVFPDQEERFLNHIGQYRDTWYLYEWACRQWEKKMIVKTGAEWRIPVARLLHHPAGSTLLYEWLRPLGFSSGQAAAVYALTRSASGAQVCSQTHRALRSRNWLIITSLTVSESFHVPVSATDTRISFAAGLLQVKECPPDTPIETKADTAMLDADRIRFPLLLRTWRAGDYFYPLGLNGKKKLARFFIDLKLPLHQKEKIWVLESEGKIVWVMGYRIDHRFRVTEKTRRIIRFSFSASQQ